MTRIPDPRQVRDSLDQAGKLARQVLREYGWLHASAFSPMAGDDEHIVVTTSAISDPTANAALDDGASAQRRACRQASHEIDMARAALSRALGICQRSQRDGKVNAPDHDGGFDTVEAQYVSPDELEEARAAQKRRAQRGLLYGVG